MSAPRNGDFALPTLAPDEPLRVVLVGAGEMGRTWITSILASPDVELVGLVDLDVSLAERRLAEAGVPGVVIGTSCSAVALQTGAHAVINVTVPAAHHPVNVEALFAGLPVLCEKPIAPTLAQAISLAGAAEASGQLLMVSQSRRYFRGIAAFRDQVSTLGDLAVAETSFYKAPHFGGFREEMEHVLLIDMAIHAFDASRFVLGADPLAVYCEEHNPPWSWFRDDAAATAIFEFEGGIRYTYTGSWCSPGLETSWNGSWRVSGSEGAASWDGDGAPILQRVGAEPEVAILDPSAPEETRGSLAEFASALRTGIVPSGEVHSNVRSLAMVEAAIRSSETGVRVEIEAVLHEAYEVAVEAERRDDIRARLNNWGSVRHGLALA